MIKKSDNTNGNAHRVITFLTRDELDFLDKLGKDALFSSGSKLSRSKIISAMVNVIRKLDIDACGLNSKRELERRIIEAMRSICAAMSEKVKKKAENKNHGENENEKSI